MKKPKAHLVNSTCSDIRGFVEEEVFKCITNRTALPEELADIFQLELFEKDGVPCGTLKWA